MENFLTNLCYFYKLHKNLTTFQNARIGAKFAENSPVFCRKIDLLLLFCRENTATFTKRQTKINRSYGGRFEYLAVNSQKI